MARFLICLLAGGTVFLTYASVVSAREKHKAASKPKTSIAHLPAVRLSKAKAAMQASVSTGNRSATAVPGGSPRGSVEAPRPQPRPILEPDYSRRHLPIPGDTQNPDVATPVRGQ